MVVRIKQYISSTSNTLTHIGVQHTLQEEENALELNREGGGEFQESDRANDTADLRDNLI